MHSKGRLTSSLERRLRADMLSTTPVSSTTNNGNTSFSYHGSAGLLTKGGHVSAGEAQVGFNNGNHAAQRRGPATASGRQYSFACSKFTFPFTKSAPVAEQRKEEVADVHTPNIVIFGETGVGKSSVVNLITGQKHARASNDAVSSTFQHERHPFTLGGVSCALWDTTGLDEGCEQTTSAALAESNLRTLIQGLARGGGIHLVVCCIRADRPMKALQHNYDLFYATVCRKKVPVALVVTRLEYQKVGMETWWNEHEEDLRRSGMWFDAHACVTTLDIEDQIVQERRSDSQHRLRELVLGYSRLSSWKIGPSFIAWVLPTVRDVLRRTSPPNRQITTKTVQKVVICDAAADSQIPTQLSPGIAAVWQKLDGLIYDRRYDFIRMDKHIPQAPTSTLQPVRGVAAGILVFYTSPLGNTGISPRDVDALKAFHEVAGGQTCPVVVVLRDCNDEEAAQKHWGDVTSRHCDIHAYVTFLPSTVDGQSDAQIKLNEMIERLCIEHVEDVPTAFPKDRMTGKRFFAAIAERLRFNLRMLPDL